MLSSTAFSSARETGMPVPVSKFSLLSAIEDYKTKLFDSTPVANNHYLRLVVSATDSPPCASLMCAGGNNSELSRRVKIRFLSLLSKELTVRVCKFSFLGLKTGFLKLVPPYRLRIKLGFCYVFERLRGGMSTLFRFVKDWWLIAGSLIFRRTLLRVRWVRYRLDWSPLAVSEELTSSLQEDSFSSSISRMVLSSSRARLLHSESLEGCVFYLTVEKYSSRVMPLTKPPLLVREEMHSRGSFSKCTFRGALNVALGLSEFLICSFRCIFSVFYDMLYSLYRKESATQQCEEDIINREVLANRVSLSQQSTRSQSL